MCGPRLIPFAETERERERERDSNAKPGLGGTTLATFAGSAALVRRHRAATLSLLARTHALACLADVHSPLSGIGLAAGLDEFAAVRVLHAAATALTTGGAAGANGVLPALAGRALGFSHSSSSVGRWRVKGRDRCGCGVGWCYEVRDTKKNWGVRDGTRPFPPHCENGLFLFFARSTL